MAQTRLGVDAPWRVVRIIAQICTLNEYLPNHQFHLAEMAETLGFFAAVLEGFSEPPCLRVQVRAVGESGIIRQGGMARAAPAIAPVPVMCGPDGRPVLKYF